MTKIDYVKGFYFVVGLVIGCTGHEAINRLLGW